MKYIINISIVFIMLFAVSVKAETLNFVTDRYLYITGEKVQVYGKIDANKNQSTIVYADIISPEYEIISSAKFITEDSYFSTALDIPEYQNSSVCMIRVYTKFMRNTHIKYTYLKIVNPDFSDVKQPQKMAEVELVKRKNNFPSEFRQNKRSYKKSEKVELSCEINTIGFMVITPDNLNFSYPLMQYETNDIEQKKFEKEINSFNISGKCLSDNRKSKRIKVNFSIIGEKNYQSVYSDSLGNFSIKTFYYQGERQLYIYAEDAKVLIDNDFAVIPSSLKFPEFEITDNEKSILLSLINNSKIAGQYFINDTVNIVKDDYSAFYGKADEQVYLHDYVDMENLVDYFNEIPGLVNVENEESDNPVFKIRTDDPRIEYFRPLVMVNYLQINNNKKILQVSPMLIEKIEVINSVYIKDNFYYGGIINFITKQGQFDNSVLPENSVIVNYKFINKEIKRSNIKNYPFNFNSYIKNFKANCKINFNAPDNNFTVKVFEYDKNSKLNYFERRIKVISNN